MNQHQHVVCPNCGSINRVPRQRLGESPNCGQCKQPLFSGEPAVLNDRNFSTHVDRSDLPVAVDFWAPWCGPCKTMAPHFARAASLLEPQVRLAKLNTDENPAVAGRYGIRSIPTVILFKHGKEIARQAGAVDSNSLQNWIRSRISDD